MNRYAHEHPEQFEPGGAEFEPLFEKGDGRGHCVGCGDPTTGGARWCSEACRRAEDGPSFEEEAEQEREEWAREQGL